MISPPLFWATDVAPNVLYVDNDDDGVRFQQRRSMGGGGASSTASFPLNLLHLHPQLVRAGVMRERRVGGARSGARTRPTNDIILCPQSSCPGRARGCGVRWGGLSRLLVSIRFYHAAASHIFPVWFGETPLLAWSAWPRREAAFAASALTARLAVARAIGRSVGFRVVTVVVAVVVAREGRRLAPGPPRLDPRARGHDRPRGRRRRRRRRQRWRRQGRRRQPARRRARHDDRQVRAAARQRRRQPRQRDGARGGECLSRRRRRRRRRRHGPVPPRRRLVRSRVCADGEGGAVQS